MGIICKFDTPPRSRTNDHRKTTMFVKMYLLLKTVIFQLVTLVLGGCSAADPQDFVSQVTNAGRSALWIAAGTGHAAAVRFLLQLCAVSGVEVNGPPLFLE